MRAKPYNQTWVRRAGGEGFAFCRTRKKNEDAEAPLAEVLPCCCVCEAVQQARRKQSTVIERLSLTSQEEPTPFRCSGPHSPSKVEGVAGTIAMGRSLRHSDPVNHLIRNALR